MKTIKNKKAAIAPFPFLVAVMGILILYSLLASIMGSYAQLKKWNDEDLGAKAVEVLQTYQDADNALLYLDNSVQLSMQQAVFDLGNNGFYASGSSSCGGSTGQVWWREGIAEKITDEKKCKPVKRSCIPTNYNSFNNYFMTELNAHISSFNNASDVKLLQSNYNNLQLSSKPENLLELVGTADNPIVVENSRLRYEVLPSFREGIDVDLIGDFEKITEKIIFLIAASGDNIDESQIVAAIDAYNNEAADKLRWNVDVSDCEGSRECFIEECDIEREEEECETVKTDRCVVDVATSELICEEEEECETVTYNDPGKFVHDYCSRTATVSVKIIDDAYKTGSGEGYKIFPGNMEDYTYRFAINWVEMEGNPDCKPIV